MQITALQNAIKDKERVNVYIDGEFAIAIDKNTLTQEHLYLGKEIDSNILQKLKELDTYNYLTRKIIDWTFIRPRSSKEVKEKLHKILSKRRSKSIDVNIAFTELYNYVVNRLDSLGINDQKYGEWLINARQSQGKYGPQKIYAELLTKGISQNVAKQLMDKFYNQDNQKAIELLNKKFGVSSTKEIKDFKLRTKAYNFLIQKGYKPF